MTDESKPPQETVKAGSACSAGLGCAIEALETLIDWPGDGYSRRTDDGYPSELVYDQFAYERIVDSYRNAILAILADLKKEAV